MAGGYLKLQRSIFADPDFLALTERARWTYVTVLLQPDLTMAGVTVLLPVRLAHHVGCDTDQLDDALTELEAGEFVMVDRDTCEIAVKSYAKYDCQTGNIKMVKGCVAAFERVLSPAIRSWLWDHLPNAVQSLIERPPIVERSPIQFRSNSDPSGDRSTPDHQPIGSRSAPDPSLSPKPLTHSPEPDPLPTPDVTLTSGQRMTAAAVILAEREATRRTAAGEVGNPEGYARSRTPPIRRLHEHAWLLIIEDHPNATPLELADAVTRPTTAPEPKVDLRHAAFEAIVQHQPPTMPVCGECNDTGRYVDADGWVQQCDHSGVLNNEGSAA